MVNFTAISVKLLQSQRYKAGQIKQFTMSEFYTVARKSTSELPRVS